ncbi:MAG: 2-nitropropane dioxygenase [Thermoanaerobaculia bacterium]
MADKLEITCPCCDAKLTIDTQSGAILWHEKKAAPAKTIEGMLSQLESQKSEIAKKFEKEMESHKDRSRLLEEKFKEALQRAEKSKEKPINPMDLD